MYGQVKEQEEQGKMKAKNSYQKRAFENAKYFVIKPNGSLRSCADKQTANADNNEIGSANASIKQTKERGNNNEHTPGKVK